MTESHYMLTEPFHRFTVPFGTSYGRVWAPVDVTFLPNGNVVVAENKNKRIQIFNDEGNFIRVIGEGNISPQGVAVTARGNILVTDNVDDCIKVFTLTGKFVSSWIKNMYGWPSAVAVAGNGSVLVSDLGCDRHSVSIHSPDGQGAQIFGSFGARDVFFKEPKYVAVDTNDLIYVSDCWNHCVKVFNFSKNFLYKFGSKGSEDGQLKQPHGVCVDVCGNVIVADCGNNRISMFDRTGKFCRHLLFCRKPRGVAVSETGLLAVTESDLPVYHSALNIYRLYANIDK